MRRTIALVATLVLIVTACHRAPDPLAGFPKLVLWAWERPEDLRCIVPSATAVAFLAGTIRLQDGRCDFRPRMQPLRVPPATDLIAVVRIESDGHQAADVPALVEKILPVVSEPSVKVLQIDFDARRSERPFYRSLIADLRRRLPRQMPLEITALVSWCLSDDWLRGLPIAEAVPMFFRMGADPHSVREALHEPLCRASIGVSTDEVYTEVPRGRRMFVFNPHAWTETDYRAILKESGNWR